VRERIQRAFLRNLIRRQGTALLGRALPFGIGAVVGGVGNRTMGRAVVANAKAAFGPMPDTIPGELQAGPGGSAPRLRAQARAESTANTANTDNTANTANTVLEGEIHGFER
jgi:hypothetical protein